MARCLVHHRVGDTYQCDKVRAGQRISYRMSTVLPGERRVVETQLCDECSGPFLRMRGSEILPIGIPIKPVEEVKPLEVPDFPDSGSPLPWVSEDPVEPPIAENVFEGMQILAPDGTKGEVALVDEAPTEDLVAVETARKAAIREKRIIALTKARAARKPKK